MIASDPQKMLFAHASWSVKNGSSQSLHPIHEEA
jgi:hypothetical protein